MTINVTQKPQPTAAEPDAYDAAVAYFTEHPKSIYKAWNAPKLHRYGYLFSYLSDTRNREDGDAIAIACGCPSMIKCGGRGVYHAVGLNGKEIDDTIAGMALPSYTQMLELESYSPDQLIIDALPLFAEAQRLGDRLIPGRVKPTVKTAT